MESYFVVKSLANGAAVEICDTDITKYTKKEYDRIRDHLLHHQVVVIKNQTTNPFEYTKFIENVANPNSRNSLNYGQFAFTSDGKPFTRSDSVPTRSWFGSKEDYPVQRVTGKKINGKFSGIFSTGKLDWHANLNGLNRADGVALQGYKHCEQTSTSFLNGSMALDYMDLDLLDEIEDLYAEYEYAPEVWAEGLPEDQLKRMKQNSGKYRMKLVQENCAGVKGLYFYTNNKCRVVTPTDNLYTQLYDHMFQEKFMYQHWWEPGDIVLMDQLLTLHKRDQNDPEILAERVLHRITFRLSNVADYVRKYNSVS